MTDQPELIEGVRVLPPKCYDVMASCLDNLLSDFPEMLEWPDEDIAWDALHFAGFAEDVTYNDMLKSIRIWRERNA